jgi:hypothetical protein
MTVRAYPYGAWVAATRGVITEPPEVTRQVRRDGVDAYPVMSNPRDWDGTPRRAENAGRVSLGSFRSEDRGAITVVDGSGRNRVGGTATTSAGVQ